MKPFINIAGREIGYDHDPLIIAEIGINHGGSLDVAKKIVDTAAEVGVEIIKHQTHIVEDEMSTEAKKVKPGHTKESIYEIMAQCSLNEDDEIYLKEYVENKGMIFISTPFSRAAVDRLERMNVPAYKIGSGECNNYPLIRYIAKFGKPIILSTGMNTIESITKAVSIFEENKIQYALLHCTNVYPTPYDAVRLGALVELSKNFPNAVIGLSDHTISNIPCLGAVALGASILERHFTDSKSRIGPDIVCSMTPQECKELIESSKIMKMARGGKKAPIDLEKPTIDFAFGSVVSIVPIKKGETFSTKNIWVKRPGTGEILAEHYETLIGKKSMHDIVQNVQISWKDVERS